VILARVRERMAYCWRMMDAQVSPGRYILGEDLSVLDLYVTVGSSLSVEMVWSTVLDLYNA
jgi:GST-like protein